MAEAVRKGGKKNRKLGRCKDKCTAYRNAHTRERNKLKRILQSSGYIAAADYARMHGLNAPKQKGEPVKK